MDFKQPVTRVRVLCISLLSALLLFGVGTANAQYLLTGNSGARLQIGTGLPLPVGTQGIFLGGMTPVNGGTTCGAGPGGCPVGPIDGPGTAYWPQLRVLPNPNLATGCGGGACTIIQNNATAAGGTIIVPPTALHAPPPGAPVPVGVFTTNPALFQVATTLDFHWPAATATLAPGGAPGPAVLGTPSGGVIAYSGGAKSFGGPAQFVIQPGPAAGSGRVPPNGLGVVPGAEVWINFAGALPTTVMAVAVVGASQPNSVAVPGGPITAPAATTMFGPITPGAGPFGAVNNPVIPACVSGCPVTPMGSIVSSFPLPTVMIPTPMGGTFMLAGLSNMVTATKGFPWTTGFITVSQPGAVPPEIFFLSGTDMRVAGQGNISLVTGGLSLRALSGPNANRAWLSLTLPEPTVALGSAGALAMLALCHGLVRRRSS